MNKFPCSGCGLCCKRLNTIKYEIPKSIFPYNWDESGRCEMLTDDDKCAVYDDRPLICNIDRMYDTVHNGSMTREDYHMMNAIICNKWMDENNLPIKLRINYGVSEKGRDEVHRQVAKEDPAGNAGQANDKAWIDGQDKTKRFNRTKRIEGTAS